MVSPLILADLWNEHATQLTLIARSLGGPAEDAVQEAFISLAAQPTLPDDPKAWLVRVTRNQLLQWHRSDRRRRRRESVVQHESWFDSDAMTAQQRIEAMEVTRVLQTLPSPDREIIVMHLWGEMTFDSIAKVVGGSRANAHRRFNRGLQTLRKKLDPDFIPEGVRL